MKSTRSVTKCQDPHMAVAAFADFFFFKMFCLRVSKILGFYCCFVTLSCGLSRSLACLCLNPWGYLSDLGYVHPKLLPAPLRKRIFYISLSIYISLYKLSLRRKGEIDLKSALKSGAQGNDEFSISEHRVGHGQAEMGRLGRGVVALSSGPKDPVRFKCRERGWRGPQQPPKSPLWPSRLGNK